MKPSLSIIVLTFNEEIHIERLLKSIHEAEKLSPKLMHLPLDATDKMIELIEKNLG